MNDKQRPGERDAPPSAAARSAARDVYNFPEIKQQILSLLDKHTLTRFMRVEKKGVFDVSRELYRSMSYIWVRSHMTVTTARQRTYCSAIEEIDARGTKFKIAPAMLKQTDFGLANPKPRPTLTAEYLAKYNTQVFNLVVPPMRKKCAGLRRIVFGSEYAPLGEETWMVHFDPAAPEEEEVKGKGRRKSLKKESTEGGGYIEYQRTWRPSLAEAPPTTVDPPQSPTDLYTIRFRFDLDLRLSRHTGLHTGSWLAALRGSPLFGDLYRAVDLADLPITLADLSTLYRRQVEAGRTILLSHVTAVKCIPWSTEDLRSFAGVASTALTSLTLTGNSSYAVNEEDLSKITFADLPTIIDILHTTLPNLYTLRFAVRDAAAAETACLHALDERVLSEPGKLTSLVIRTPRSGPIFVSPQDRDPLFNVVRLLSRLCTRSANIAVGASYVFSHRDKEQSEFLQCLWRQSPSSRKHLATIDFSTLGVTRLREVQELGYHADGRPMGLWQNLVTGMYLSGSLRRAREALSSGSGALDRELATCGEAAEELEAICAVATTAQMMGPANRLRAAYRQTIEQAESHNKSLLGGDKLENDIRTLVSKLKKMGREYDWDTDSDSESGLYDSDYDSDSSAYGW